MNDFIFAVAEKIVSDLLDLIKINAENKSASMLVDLALEKSGCEFEHRQLIFSHGQRGWVGEEFHYSNPELSGKFVAEFSDDFDKYARILYTQDGHTTVFFMGLI